MNNIIFVDIDGPLLPGKMAILSSNRRVIKKLQDRQYDSVPQFDPAAVNMFNLWAKYGQAKVVFITTWALQGQDSVDYVKHIMKFNGLDFDYHTHDIVPRGMTIRKEECLSMWIEEYAQEGDNLLIVDDAVSSGACKSLLPYWKKYAKSKDFSANALDVSYNNGLQYGDLYEGLNYLHVDVEDFRFKEYGIKPLTDMERALSYAVF